MANDQRRKKIRQAVKWIAGVLLVQFILINISAAFHAHRFTHYYDSDKIRNLPPSSGTVLLRTWRMMVGKRLPKSQVNHYPLLPYDTVILLTKKGIPLEGWKINRDSALGTVILFHGLSSNKGGVLSIAYQFYEMGYNTFLLDMRAHGNSGSTSFSLGYKESEEVKLAYDYVRSSGEKNIILWGTSMGAVVISKAIADYAIRPGKVILEMPFDRLRDHLQGRARLVNFPGEPFGFMVTFWIGVEEGYWGFSHRTSSYVRSIACPVLLQWGRNDPIVKEQEINTIYNSIPGNKKQLDIYDTGGHYPMLHADEYRWKQTMERFLKS